jgi:hypothetical protein
MSQIRYDGEGAGLGKELTNGDRNNAANYTVICKCGVTLGPLARFMQNKDGDRSPFCPMCERLTIVDKNGQVKYCDKPPAELLAKVFKKESLS